MRTTLKSFGYSNEQGFTLIELVSVIALVLIVIGALYSSYFSGFEAYRFNDNQAVAQQSARAAVQNIIYEAGSSFKVDSFSNNSELTLKKTGASDVSFKLDNWDAGSGTWTLYKNSQPVTDNIKAMDFTGTSQYYLRLLLTTNKGSSDYTVRTAVYVDERSGKGKRK